MTIIRSYNCDLCDDSHAPNTGNLIGLYWAGNALVLKTDTNSVIPSEHHLCMDCYRGIHDLIIL